MRGAEVYRAFDHAGRLLYVGCSVDVEARLRQHERTAVWWPFQSRITREVFESHEDALTAEKAAIAAEHPRWNIKDRSVDHPDGAATNSWDADWLAYERSVSQRLGRLVNEERQLMKQIRRVRFALAGTRLEVEAISSGSVEIEEEIA